MLERFSALGLLKARGQQRTGSIHVLAAVRNLRRLENIGETLRTELNSVAGVAPDWLAGLIDAEWFERYGQRVEDYRLPTSATQIRALAQVIGADGHKLLAALYAPIAPVGLRALDVVETLRITWIQQLHCQDDTMTWRRPTTCRRPVCEPARPRGPLRQQAQRHLDRLQGSPDRDLR
jgi:transposase